jgi:hypothetical protein
MRLLELIPRAMDCAVHKTVQLRMAVRRLLLLLLLLAELALKAVVTLKIDQSTADWAGAESLHRPGSARVFWPRTLIAHCFCFCFCSCCLHRQ